MRGLRRDVMKLFATGKTKKPLSLEESRMWCKSQHTSTQHLFGIRPSIDDAPKSPDQAVPDFWPRLPNQICKGQVGPNAINRQDDVQVY